MRGLVARLLRSGMRQGWRRGVVDGKRVWVVVGGLALLGRLAGRVVGRQAEVVFSEELKPGEVFRITHEAPKGS